MKYIRPSSLEKLYIFDKKFSRRISNPSPLENLSRRIYLKVKERKIEKEIKKREKKLFSSS